MLDKYFLFISLKSNNMDRLFKSAIFSKPATYLNYENMSKHCKVENDIDVIFTENEHKRLLTNYI